MPFGGFFGRGDALQCASQYLAQFAIVHLKGTIPLTGGAYRSCVVGRKRWLLGYITFERFSGLSVTSDGPHVGQAM